MASLLAAGSGFFQGLNRGADAASVRRQNEERIGLERQRVGLEEQRIQQQAEQEEARVAEARRIENLAAAMEAIQQVSATTASNPNTAVAKSATMETLINAATELGGNTSEINRSIAEGAAFAASPLSPQEQVRIANETVELINRLPEENQRAVSQLMGITQQSLPEFLTLMNELKQVEKNLATEGIAAKDSDDAQLILQRINALLRENTPEGQIPITLEFDAEGNITGPDGTAIGQQLTPSQQIPRVDEINDLKGSINLIDDILLALENKPSAFAILGSIQKGLLQPLEGLFAISGVDILYNTTIDAARALGLAEGRRLVDPQIGAGEATEIMLAVSLTKLQVQAGGDEIRSIAQIYKDNKRLVRLTGATSPAIIEDRLRHIRSEFAEALANIQRTTIGEGGTETTAPTTEPFQVGVGVNQSPEIRAQFDALIGGK